MLSKVIRNCKLHIQYSSLSLRGFSSNKNRYDDSDLTTNNLIFNQTYNSNNYRNNKDGFNSNNRMRNYSPKQERYYQPQHHHQNYKNQQNSQTQNKERVSYKIFIGNFSGSYSNEILSLFSEIGPFVKYYLDKNNFALIQYSTRGEATIALNRFNGYEMPDGKKLMVTYTRTYIKDNELNNQDEDLNIDLDNSVILPEKLKLFLEKSKFNEHQYSDILISFFEENYQNGIPYLIYNQETVDILVESYLELNKVEHAIHYFNKFVTTDSFNQISKYFIDNNQFDKFTDFLLNHFDTLQYTIDLLSYEFVFSYIVNNNNKNTALEEPSSTQVLESSSISSSTLLTNKFEELLSKFLSKDYLLSDLITGYLMALINNSIESCKEKDEISTVESFNSIYSIFNKHTSNISSEHQNIIISNLIKLIVCNKNSSNIQVVEKLVDSLNSNIDIASYQSLIQYLINLNQESPLLYQVKSRLDYIQLSLLIYYNRQLKDNSKIIEFLEKDIGYDNFNFNKSFIEICLLNNNTTEANSYYINILYKYNKHFEYSIKNFTKSENGDSGSSQSKSDLIKDFKKSINQMNQITELFVNHHKNQKSVVLFKFWKRLLNRNVHKDGNSNSQEEIENNNNLMKQFNSLKKLTDQDISSVIEKDKELKKLLLGEQYQNFIEYLKQNYIRERDGDNYNSGNDSSIIGKKKLLNNDELIEIFEYIKSSKSQTSLELITELFEYFDQYKLLFKNYSLYELYINNDDYTSFFDHLNSHKFIFSNLLFNSYEPLITINLNNFKDKYLPKITSSNKGDSGNNSIDEKNRIYKYFNLITSSIYKQVNLPTFEYEKEVINYEAILTSWFKCYLSLHLDSSFDGTHYPLAKELIKTIVSLISTSDIRPLPNLFDLYHFINNGNKSFQDIEKLIKSDKYENEDLIKFAVQTIYSKKNDDQIQITGSDTEIIQLFFKDKETISKIGIPFMIHSIEHLANDKHLPQHLKFLNIHFLNNLEILKSKSQIIKDLANKLNINNIK